MTFKIMTSNIRFDNPEDGIHTWENRRPVLTKLIQKISPIILGTQEGRRPQLKNLETHLKNYSLIETHRKWIDERMYPSFFILKDTMEVLDCGDKWLSLTPEVPGSRSFESAFPRLMTWIKIKLKRQGPFFIVNTHLDHVLPATRLGQIKVLIEQCNILNQDPVLPIILMGDFNEGPKEKVRDILYQSWPHIYDPWEFFKLPEESSHHGFDPMSQETKDGSRIDWILLDKHFKASSMIMHKEHFNNVYPSDHYPISLEIKI